jgi:hypothetical protein
MRLRPAPLAIALAAAALSPACATRRPVFYPNAHWQQVGQAAAEDDVDACFEAASDFGLTAHPEREAAAATGVGSASGAAMAGAWGAVRGDAGTRAGAGAAAGAAGGLLRGLLRWREPDPIQRAFVQRCLGDQGYAIIGWR